MCCTRTSLQGIGTSLYGLLFPAGINVHLLCHLLHINVLVFSFLGPPPLSIVNDSGLGFMGARLPNSQPLSFGYAMKCWA